MVQQTALYEEHRSLGAKMVEFSGWKMPLQYQGIRQEHLHVRSKVGLFDVSHMGRIEIQGREALRFCEYIGTGAIQAQKGCANYSVLTNERGKAVDDCLIYCIHPNHFFLIVNAGNREKDWNHLLQLSQQFDVQLSNTYKSEGILALQGPYAPQIIQSLFPDFKNIKPMHFLHLPYRGEEIIISSTGYTGELGVEIIAPIHLLVGLWRELLEEGKTEGIAPVGLGARDTLRLEKGFALYGHELSLKISPLESVAAWTLKKKTEDFLGKEAIELLKQSQGRFYQYPVLLTEKGIARENYKVYDVEGKEIGRVTSGTFSPSLDQAIAIIHVCSRLNKGENIMIQIRKQKVVARVVSFPFVAKKA